ncbi:MAG: hypothetical protein ABIX36_17105 [Mucilaginibacter sp.]|uniref:hypothetical protein n=1 Tax=Mucilaginibacter sp. TaxID=1882438 RepID=UPI0032644BA1
MNNFSLIAVRPLGQCAERFRKNLISDEPYIFHQAYTFETEGTEIKKIVYHPLLDNDLYTIRRSQKDELQISMSAVVGKNGSGKSTIFELVFLIAYVIANKELILKDNWVKATEDLEREKLKGQMNDYQVYNLTKELEEHQRLFKDLAAEIYYRDGQNIKSIRVIEGERTAINYHDTANENAFLPADINFPFSISNEEFGRYFYSVVINYSLYGLNPSKSGQWLRSLFHKNDGYQAPVVINPYRTKEGNINVNSELHLAQSRLMANLMDETMVTKNILVGKPIEYIMFMRDESHFTEVEGADLSLSIENQEIKHGENLEEVFVATYEALLGETCDLKECKRNVKHFTSVCKYVYKKLLKIAVKYYPDDKYHLYSEGNRELEIPQLGGYLHFLADKNSHVTLKLKQILNCARYGFLREEKNEKVEWNGIWLRVPVQVLEKRLKAAVKGKKRFDILEIMPASFYRPSFILKGGTDFHSLSSGEQHLVHTTQAILYHLINLNTVFNRDGLLKYKHINLMLDEVELYFHPDFQKQIVSEILSGIGRLKIPNIKSINILFSTHSPFILSDIPKNHVLKIDEGNPAPVRSETFGANIHDLLADSFFLKGGFMGIYAQQQIQEAISYMENYVPDTGLQVKNNKISPHRWNENTIPELIKLIGEPVLKKAVENLYYKTFTTKLDEEIARLMQLKNTQQ